MAHASLDEAGAWLAELAGAPHRRSQGAAELHAGLRGFLAQQVLYPHA